MKSFSYLYTGTLYQNLASGLSSCPQKGKISLWKQPQWTWLSWGEVQRLSLKGLCSSCCIIFGQLQVKAFQGGQKEISPLCWRESKTLEFNGIHTSSPASAFKTNLPNVYVQFHCLKWPRLILPRGKTRGISHSHILLLFSKKLCNLLTGHRSLPVEMLIL